MTNYDKFSRDELRNALEELENKIKRLIRDAGRSNMIMKSEVEGLLE